jgi:HAD superfamily hydrolase (TIGR01509 family)
LVVALRQAYLCGSVLNNHPQTFGARSGVITQIQSMSIQALIFDFDGLIIDTETSDVRAWQRIYSENGVTFPIESWGQIIGGTGASHFDAAIHLQALLGKSIDLALIRSQQEHASYLLTARQPVLPGVLDCIQTAQRLSLKLAIASSSPHAWVDTHLARLSLINYFDPIICAEDVPPGRTKPYPDLFLKVLEELDLRANEAIIFEDSPNGIKAAKAAAIYVVAVPNPTTSLLKIEGADQTLKSLTDFDLQKSLAKASGAP